MKNLFLLIFAFATSVTYSQNSVLRLEKMSIPECDCSVYMPKGSVPFEKSYSEDSSLVFTNEYVTEDNFVFGAITVKFKQNLGDDKAVYEEMLIAYLDYLKAQFEVTAAAGYGKGHTLENNPDAIGIIDFWQIGETGEIAVKGWIDGGNLAILYIFGISEYPVYNIQQMFLDGFRFE